MAYWLMKSEPSAFSIDDLARVQTSGWDGVRNYQARNMMRDDMSVGDLAFFYHSNATPPGIVGCMEIVKSAYPDPTAFDISDSHYDPKSHPDRPRWWMVGVAFSQKFSRMLTLQEIKQDPLLSRMRIAQNGNRLSITPVSPEEWVRVFELLVE